MTSLEPLYDVEWQCLRVSLLKDYNDYGGFATEQGVAINVTKLREYLDEFVTEEVVMNLRSIQGAHRSILIEAYLRNWRVLNLLDAVLLGYGSRMYGSTQAEIIKEFQLECSEIHKKFNATGFNFSVIGSWDWDKVNSDLHSLMRDNPMAFWNVKENLDVRVATANRRKNMANRRELSTFLAHMTSVQLNKPY